MSPSESPPPPPEGEHPRRRAWWGPPAGVVPGVVPVELLMARTAERAIGLTGIRAYPNGFAFTLSVRLRQAIPGEQTRFGMFGDHVDPSGEFAAYYLRLGVQFADGCTATNLQRHHRGFQAGGPGPLVFVCEWPARGIGQSRMQADARLVLEAAERAVPIWPED